MSHAQMHTLSRIFVAYALAFADSRVFLTIFFRKYQQ